MANKAAPVMSGESKNFLGSFHSDAWVNPLGNNLKRVGFYVQVLALCLTIIGAICIGSQNAKESALIRNLNAGIPNGGMWGANVTQADGSVLFTQNAAPGNLVFVSSEWHWIFSASVVVAVFAIVGFLEPTSAAYTSMAAGTGLFLAITGPLLTASDTLLSRTTKFFDLTATIKTTTVEDTIIAGALLCFIGACLAVFSFFNLSSTPENSSQNPASTRKRGFGVDVGIAFFFFLVEFTGAIILMIWATGRTPADVAGVAQLGVGRKPQYLAEGIIAFLQAFYFLFAAISHSRTHTHAIAAFSGFFSWGIMINALQLHAANRNCFVDFNNTGNADPALNCAANALISRPLNVNFDFDVGMTGWALIFISQFLIVIFAIVWGARQSFRVLYINDQPMAGSAHKDVAPISGITKILIWGIGLLFIAGIITGIIISGAHANIQPASYWATSGIKTAFEWNWKVAYGILPAVALFVGLAFERYVASDVAAAMILAASGEWITMLYQTWVVFMATLKVTGTTPVGLVAPTNLALISGAAVPFTAPAVDGLIAIGSMAVGPALNIVLLWFLTFLYFPLFPRAARVGKLSKGSPFSWVKFGAAIFLALFLWIGAIVAWSVNLFRYGNSGLFWPLSSLFSVTTEVFVLGWWFLFAYGSQHGPSAGAVQFFVGWELFQTLFLGITTWKNYIIQKPICDYYCGLFYSLFPFSLPSGIADAAALDLFYKNTISAGFSIMFVALCLVWIFLTFVGPDNRPGSDPMDKIPPAQEYVYDDYDYSYSRSASGRSSSRGSYSGYSY